MPADALDAKAMPHANPCTCDGGYVDRFCPEHGEKDPKDAQRTKSDSQGNGGTMNAPQRFRKKPVEVEAIQFTGKNANAIAHFVGDDVPIRPGPSQIDIHTLEGTMTASKNDWIIKGVQGEFYPCKPDIFEATYDRA